MARQAHERAAVAADRLQQRVREASERLDRVPSLARRMEGVAEPGLARGRPSGEGSLNSSRAHPPGGDGRVYCGPD